MALLTVLPLRVVLLSCGVAGSGTVMWGIITIVLMWHGMFAAHDISLRVVLRHRTKHCNSTLPPTPLASRFHPTFFPFSSTFRRCNGVVCQLRRSGAWGALCGAGDLNSTPETGVVEFMCTGQLSPDHKVSCDWFDCNTGEHMSRRIA